MQCLRCESNDLYAEVTIQKSLPLARRRGTVSVHGYKVSQKALKQAWDTESGVERLIRGPIICADCGAEHFYVKGGSDNKRLRLGSYAEAKELGFEAVIQNDFGASTSKAARETGAEDEYAEESAGEGGGEEE